MSTPFDSRAASVERADTPAGRIEAALTIAATLGGLSDKEVADYWYQRAIEVESEMLDLRSLLAEREAECERLLADAERYRAIRSMGWSVEFNGLWPGAAGWRVHDHELIYHHASSLDDAVDSARAASAAVAPAARETQETNDGK